MPPPAPAQRVEESSPELAGTPAQVGTPEIAAMGTLVLGGTQVLGGTRANCPSTSSQAQEQRRRRRRRRRLPDCARLRLQRQRRRHDGVHHPRRRAARPLRLFAWLPPLASVVQPVINKLLYTQLNINYMCACKIMLINCIKQNQ